MITIHRPVQVKIVVTEASRHVLVAEYERQSKQLEKELKQWQFQGKRLLAEAKKKSADWYKQALEKISQEERRRKEKLEMLQFQIKQVENLPEGSELLHTTVESSITINVGDSWDDIMSGTEILLKDGVIVEIRQGGKSDR